MIVVGILVAAGPRGTEARSPVSVTEIARRAAAEGRTESRVEVVGVVGDGPDGDRRLVELSAAGVGHAAVIRSPAIDLDSADLELALRYLPDVRVIVLAGASASLVETAATAAAWSGAALVVIDATPPAVEASPLIVLAPPASDPDAAFVGVVAALAVRLDAGEDPAAAWRAVAATLALDPA